MRKKYLSALLFGALLLASAGTFTSCSDYDDDIKNLQEQINTVVSDLESLKTKVDGLGGYVTDVKVENGKLVVTANGSTVSYDLPAGGSSEVANIEIKDGHLYVNGTDKGSVGSTVTVNEEGKLVIDGEVSDLKVGTEVIIKDASNGMYTISIDGQTIQLPMASAAIKSVVLVDEDKYAFSQPGYNAEDEWDGSNNGAGIHWVAAPKDVEWKGAMGNITKGDLLVGGISTVNVNVTPATFDLGSANLSLLDTEGKEAAVKVSALASTAGAVASGSRAAAKDGQWTLSVKMTDKATVDNMATLFTNGASTPSNLKYALAVDGVVVSGYDFVIDTQTAAAGWRAAYIADALIYNGKSLEKWGQLPVGDCKFTYNQIDCADSYFAFEGTMVEKAKKYGVVANGMTLTISEDFAKAQEDLIVTFYMLGLDGSITPQKLTIKAKNTTVDGAVEAAKTTYKVAYDKANDLKDIVVDFGTLITANMTNDEIEDIDPTKTTFAIADDKAGEFIVAGVNGVVDVNSVAKLYAGDKVYSASQSYAEITSLKLPLSKAQATAKEGSYTLVMTVKNEKGNEIKKFNFPIDITLPTFDELFTKTTKWENDKVTLRLDANTENTIKLDLSPSFEATTGVALTGIVYEIAEVNDKQVLKEQSNGVVTFTEDIKTDDNTLATKELTVTAKYAIDGAQGLTVKSSAFTANIKSIFDDVQLVYYVENAIQEFAKVGTDNTIAALTGTGENANGKRYNGLALKLGDYVVKCAGNQKLDNISLSTKAETNGVVAFDLVPTITGLSNVTAEFGSGTVTVTGMEVNDKGTMTVKFTDFSGIVTKLSIAIQK